MAAFNTSDINNTKTKKNRLKRYSPRKFLFNLIVLVLVLSLAYGLDLIFGQISDIKVIRESSQMFRNEAAMLRLKTRYLLPNVNHQYQTGPDREEDVRFFRTGPLGDVIGVHGDVKNDAVGVLFLGGSTTETNEVSEAARFPGLVGKLLSQGSDKAFVGINFGVRGNTSRDSLNLLINHPITRTATYVVLMHNINDRLLLALEGGYDAKIETNPLNASDKLVDSGVGLLQTGWDTISYQSNILFAVRKYLFEVNPWTGEGRADAVTEDAINYSIQDLDAAAGAFKENLLLISSVVKSLDKKLVIMTQPLGRESSEQAIFNEVIRGVSREADVLLIDLDRELVDQREWLFLSDDIHLNDFGSSEVAKVIASHLRKSILDIQTDWSDIEIDGETPLTNCRAPTSEHPSPDVGSRRPLMGTDGRYPVLSADQKILLFQSYRQGRERIRAFDLESGKYLSVSPDEENFNERHGVPWIADADVGGRWVLFGRKSGKAEDQDSVERLFIRKLDDEDTPTEIPISDNVSASIPSVGPDGSIYFAGSRIDKHRRIIESPDLYKFDSDTDKTIRLTQTGWEEWRPIVSSDARFVYHIANPDGQFDIFRFDTTTSKTEKTWGSSADEWDPDVSADGRWLLFASKQKGNWDIFLLDTLDNDGEPIQITDSPADEWDPRFIPNNNAILFASSSGELGPRMEYICLYGEL
jgi:hypothetical protein